MDERDSLEYERSVRVTLGVPDLKARNKQISNIPPQPLLATRPLLYYIRENPETSPPGVNSHSFYGSLLEFFSKRNSEICFM